MEIKKDQVCIFIPTLNEAPTIERLIMEFRDLGYNNILVMDGHSTDGTPEIARSAGAAVRTQKGKGKGEAIIEALGVIDAPYVLMLDGDGTYSPGDAEKMLKPLFDGYDHVIGNRLSSPEKGALTILNMTGNNILNRIFRAAHGRDLTDILSGYRAFTIDSAKHLHLKEAGFGIETEMAGESVRNNQQIAIVPVSYLKRPGTKTKLNPFHDGFRIMSTIYRLAKVNNPIFYFGIIGLVISIAGFLIGIYVIIEWLNNIEHIPLTILTLLLIMVGFEIFMFGVISDMILIFHREVLREIQRLQPPK